MTPIDNIIDCKGMLVTRQRLRDEIDELIAQAWRHVRVSKTKNSEYIPIFLGPEMDDIATKLENADKRVAELEADAAEVVTLMTGYQSLSAMARDKTSWKNALARADDAVKAAMANAVRQGIPLEDVREAPPVTEAEIKRDQIVADLSEKLKDIEPRLAKAKAIIDRYAATPQGAPQ